MRRLSILIAAALTLCAGWAGAAQDLPARYRDLKVYAVSAPSAADASLVEARVQFRNQGRKPLKLRAELAGNPKLGFEGSRFETTLVPGTRANWDFPLRPADDLDREVLEGSIWLGATRDRELYVAVEGPDPAEFNYPRIPRITAKAQVVAAHAPRTLESIRESMRSAAGPKPPLITLASGGRSEYRIALTDLAAGANAHEALGQDARLKNLTAAIRDLQRCIQIKSGATLPIVGGAEHDGPVILLGAEPGAWPHPDAYRIRTDEKGNVFLRAGTSEGVRHAIYGFLSDHLDCHWFLPARLGEEIVTSPDRRVVVGQIDELRTPSFFSASGMSWGDAPEWDLRNRSVILRGRMHFGHAWRSLLEPTEQSVKEHPDWWARDREGNILRRRESWSGTNFCSTSPEVIEIVAQKINAQFDADPGAIVASLDPNDNAPMCVCDRCLALDKSYGVTDETGRMASDRLLHFSREIHNRLKPEHKDKYLGILVYGRQFNLPVGAKPHERHAALLCQYPSRFDHSRPFTDPTSPQSRYFHELVRGWAGLVTRLGWYDYYGHYHYFGPWGVIHKMREDVPAFHEVGGAFIMIEAQPNFAVHGPNLYTMARLTWDVGTDVDLLLEDFFTKFYGPGADAMRDYWLGSERRFALLRPGAGSARHMATKADFWEEMDGYLKEAERAVADAEPRFRQRVRFQRDGFDAGRKIWELEWMLNRPAAEPDFAAAIAAHEAAQPFFDQMKAKYADRGQWPTPVRELFYPDIEEVKEAQRSYESADPSRARRQQAATRPSDGDELGFLTPEQLNQF